MHSFHFDSVVYSHYNHRKPQQNAKVVNNQPHLVPEQHSFGFHPEMNVTVHQDCQNAKHYDDRDGHVPEEMPGEEADGTGGQH